MNDDVFRLYEQFLQRENASPLMFVAMAEDATLRVAATATIRDVFFSDPEAGEALREFIILTVDKALVKVMNAPLDDLDFMV